MNEISNEFVEQVYNKELKALYSCFKKYLSYNNFIPLMENSYVIIKFHNAEKCLVNLKQLPSNDSESINYINDVWFPTVKKSGVKHVAIILPDSGPDKKSIKNTYKGAEEILGITVNHFDSEIEATKWLRNIDPSGNKNIGVLNNV